MVLEYLFLYCNKHVIMEKIVLQKRNDSKETELITYGSHEVINLLMRESGNNPEILESVNITLDDSSPLNVVSLSQAQLILESNDEQVDDPPSMVLDDNTTLVESLEAVVDADGKDVVARFVDGQLVQLEDGSTALIHASPGEGLQPIQLEDGTMAYLSQTTRADLFEEESTTIELENIASSQDNLYSRMPSSHSAGKAFRCEFPDCNRLYTTLHHMKVHARSHTGDKPFKCGMCTKAFATGYGLKSHLRVHTGETPYKCHHEHCSKAFKTSGDLQKHIRTHTGERPFKCAYDGCNRAFTTSNIRKVHIRTHTGERPYICSEDGCGRAFASATNYKNHIRIHTGEKPYICSVNGCNKRFTEYSSLYKHHVVHTHQKPYSCALCGRHYRQISTLTMHRRTAHGIVDPQEKNQELEIKDSDALELEAATLSVDIKIKNDDESEEPKKLDLSASKSKFPTLVTLQPEQASQLLHDNPVYAMQLGEDGATVQQIVLVTDPSHLVTLQQQLTAQSASLTAVS